MYEKIMIRSLQGFDNGAIFLLRDWTVRTLGLLTFSSLSDKLQFMSFGLTTLLKARMAGCLKSVLNSNSLTLKSSVWRILEQR